MKSSILFTFIFLVTGLQAQITESQAKQIDQLFEDWNELMHPGGVVGIMKDGKILYTKGYGLASVEYGVKNDENTLFNIASISKQFTAMGIVKLHLAGKLSIDDDIHKHLKDIPDFGETITIRHLMHHTSGLRSLHAMLELAGWRGNDPRTTDDLFRYVKKQRELNFKPGEEYLYCNTGYIMMARIIENVTGADFITWTKEEIFDPLGMNNTYFEENYAQIVSGNATSYYEEKKGFERAVEFWGYLGSGNAHTKIADLLKWYNNFSHPQEGWEEAFKLLQTRDAFNNGRMNDYAFGVMMDKYNRHNRIQHGGAIGGFRAFACTYPEEDLSIVLLTNFTSSDVRGNVSALSDMFLTEKPEIDIAAMQSDKVIHLKTEELQKYEANFWNDKKKITRKVYVKNDTLWYFRGEGNENALLPIGNDAFLMKGASKRLEIQFKFGDGAIKMVVGPKSNDPGYFETYFSVDRNPETYTGVFYSPELETTYTVSLEEGQLIIHHPRLGDRKATIAKEDVLRSEWPLLTIVYERNEDGICTGFSVTNGRVRNAWFEKK